jgi:hypothetical protein
MLVLKVNTANWPGKNLTRSVIAHVTWAVGPIRFLFRNYRLQFGIGDTSAASGPGQYELPTD